MCSNHGVQKPLPEKAPNPHYILWKKMKEPVTGGSYATIWATKKLHGRRKKTQFESQMLWHQLKQMGIKWTARPHICIICVQNELSQDINHSECAVERKKKILPKPLKRPSRRVESWMPTECEQECLQKKKIRKSLFLLPSFIEIWLTCSIVSV